MKIALYIPDPAWGHASDDEYETESARHRKSLEKLLNVRLKQKNIGPGADLFSFETWIAISPWWYWTAGPLALFLLGKKINAWSLSGFHPTTWLFDISAGEGQSI